MGGDWFEEQFGDPSSVQSSVLEEQALSDLAHHMNIRNSPALVHTTIQQVSCAPLVFSEMKTIPHNTELYSSVQSGPLQNTR